MTYIKPRYCLCGAQPVKVLDDGPRSDKSVRR